MDNKEIISHIAFHVNNEGRANITKILEDLKVPNGRNDRADKIGSLMEETGEYTKYIRPDDLGNILIKKSPNFELNKNIVTTNISIQNLNNSTDKYYRRLKWTNRYQLFIGGLTVLFIGFTMYLTWLGLQKDKVGLQKENQRLQLELRQYHHIVDSLYHK